MTSDDAVQKAYQPLPEADMQIYKQQPPDISYSLPVQYDFKPEWEKEWLKLNSGDDAHHMPEQYTMTGTDLKSLKEAYKKMVGENSKKT